jgi:NADPH-dependent 2,4-dienoyl-CoA reductase/sulfur reductase-like enzyme
MDEPSESRPRARSELFNDPEHARLPREDPDVADAVRAAFAEDGIDVVLGAAVDAIDGHSGNRVGARLLTPDGERKIDGSDLLVGRALIVRGKACAISRQFPQALTSGCRGG